MFVFTANKQTKKWNLRVEGITFGGLEKNNILQSEGNYEWHSGENDDDDEEEWED